MTEVEWLECADPTPMLEFLRGKASDRRCWLFAEACWRRLPSDDHTREMVAFCERAASGQFPNYEVEEAIDAAGRTSVTILNVLGTGGVQGGEPVAHIGLIRDIFGNPFRPVTADSSWLTPAVVALAQGMYESRDFGDMPILADTLQDAGCDNEDVLNHCRGPGPHVRGCWVVDLLLNKE